MSSELSSEFIRMWILKRTRLKFWLLFSLAAQLLSAVNFAGAESPLPSTVEKHSAHGFHSLYQMNYKEAKHQFEIMIRKESKHPAGYVYLASAIWLEHLSSLRRLQMQIYNRGDAFFRLRQQDRTDPALEKLFYGTIEKGLVRAELRLQKDERDLAGLYYTGTAHGAIAGYESTVKRSFLSSLQNGKKAAETHRRVLKFHRQFADAYLSVGMFNYVVGKLPPAVKLLMLLGGVKGSKEDGLLQLEKTVKTGTLAQDEAAVLLAVIYDREKRHEDALKMLRKLIEKYPVNPVFRFESATMLTKLGRFSESATIYKQLLKEEASRDYFADFVHYEYAEILFSRGSWHEAYQNYLSARRIHKKTPVGLITMSHLRAGQCLNAMGKNGDAAVEYQYVLKQPDIQASRALARQYMKTPFSMVSAKSKNESRK